MPLMMPQKRILIPTVVIALLAVLFLFPNASGQVVGGAAALLIFVGIPAAILYAVWRFIVRPMWRRRAERPRGA